MSLSAAVLDALVAAGATQDMLVAAMKADIAVRDAEVAAKLEAKRAGNRDRQQRKRERNAESRVTAVTARDERDPAPNERDNLTPTRERKTEAKASSKNGTRLPVDWEPKPLVEKTAEMVAPWPAGMIERELAKFKDHWLKTPGARGRSLDWDASYRNWLRNADERKPRHGQSTSNVTSLRGSRPDPALDLYRAACAAEDREDNLRAGPSLPALGSGGP